MKIIISASQMQKADLFTIQEEPISSLLLMERAAKSCFNWIIQNYQDEKNTLIFCGTGNNGGDGLVIAHYLLSKQENIRVYIIRQSEKCSDDFIENEKRLLKNFPNKLFNVFTKSELPSIKNDDLVIDAIFGIGLNKKPVDLSAETIEHINNAIAQVVSIDLPSGLFADKFSPAHTAIVRANHTLTFQQKKASFFFPFSEIYTGNVHVMDIKLSARFIDSCQTDSNEIDLYDVRNIFKARAVFSHKGTFGHAILICGSYGKIGAAVLAAKACLRSGVGLVTTNIPKCGYPILQSTLPEAMVITDEQNDILSKAISLYNYTAVGIGCGIGKSTRTIELVSKILETNKPLVIDADALNCIALNKKLLIKLPKGAILTPHFKEFERLTEKAMDDFHRNQLQRNFSMEYKCYVVLKGKYTCISSPEGKCYFNPTGNSGMATAGSGDVLTGILTGFLAQGYNQLDACILGVFMHGMAGDLASENLSPSYVIASDITAYLSDVFKYFATVTNDN